MVINSSTKTLPRFFCLNVDGQVEDAGSDWVSTITYRKNRSATVNIKSEFFKEGMIISNETLFLVNLVKKIR